MMASRTATHVGAGLLSPGLMGLINQLGDGNIRFRYLHGVSPWLLLLDPAVTSGVFFLLTYGLPKVVQSSQQAHQQQAQQA